MTLPVPNLDDRTFTDLVLAARERVTRSCPEWTDLSVHDPGLALVEVFAYLTETMLYRLNRLPEKAYVEFLNLLGVVRHPPAAAWVDLTFTRTGTDTTERIAVSAGTRVAAARGADPQPVVFATTVSATIPAGATEAAIRAYHCDLVEGELLGHGTGVPGLVVRAARAPMVTTTEPFDHLLGIEVPAGTVPEGGVAREYGGRTFEIWQRVSSFARSERDAKVYVLDRGSGTITFAPALDLRRAGDTTGAQPVAAVPPAHREIRLWYRTGGGPAGNVAIGSLTNLRDPIAGVAVTNREPARGGRAMEPFESALVRGPYEFFALRRAVTARDFELLATSGSSAIARARAFTRTTMWSFARPGEVEVVLVPYVGMEARPDARLPVRLLAEHQGEDVRLRTQQDLDGRSALGTGVLATWARYKAVSVRGRVIVGAQEDADAVRRRIHDRLHQTISPLATLTNPTGWLFGEPLRASNVYRMLEQAEPGVRYVDEVRFVVDEAPDDRIRAVAADSFQPGTWYAGSADTVFRSTNAGQGWEPVGRFPTETVRRIAPAPAASRPGVTARPGLVAVATRTESRGSAIHVSRDLGESWTRLAEIEAAVSDLAWIDRDDEPAILLATNVGLYEISLRADAVPLQIVVEQSHLDRGFYAVRSFVSERGVVGVAVAADSRYGVYLSLGGGRPGTFANVGLSGVDTRTLAVQLDGPNTILWAGAAESDPGRPGTGCFRARLFEANVQWQALASGWSGGTCWDLGFTGTTALAATQSAGVLRLDTTVGNPQWQVASVNCGLPLRDRTRFEATEAVDADAAGLTLAGTSRGVYRSSDVTTWTGAANRETRQQVTIPDTWLLCSGEHDIEVVREDETLGD